MTLENNEVPSMDYPSKANTPVDIGMFMVTPCIYVKINPPGGGITPNCGKVR